MKVKVNDIRPAWKRAKSDLANKWFNSNDLTYSVTSKYFFEEFGRVNKMTVCIKKYERGIPVIDEVIFTDVQSYAWFLLRWS